MCFIRPQSSLSDVSVTQVNYTPPDCRHERSVARWFSSGRIKVGRWDELVRARRCDAVDWDMDEIFLRVLRSCFCFGIISTLVSSRTKIYFSDIVMEVIRETLWKRCFSTPTKPSEKNSSICLSETTYQHKGTRKKCKKTDQAAIIQWQRQCLMDKLHRKPWPKSKTSNIRLFYFQPAFQPALASSKPFVKSVCELVQGSKKTPVVQINIKEFV